jgi:hypothetical protein
MLPWLIKNQALDARCWRSRDSMKLKLYTLKLYKQNSIHKLHTHTLELVIVYGTNSLKKKEEEDE